MLCGFPFFNPRSIGTLLKKEEEGSGEKMENKDIPWLSLYKKKQIESSSYNSQELKFTSETIVKRIYSTARAMHDAFTSAGIHYWTSGGTTLGCVRHGGLIPWDDDLDVCIHKNDLTLEKLTNAREILTKDGFDLVETPRIGYRVFHTSDSERIATDHCYPFCDVFIMEQSGCDTCHIADERGRTRWPSEEYTIADARAIEQKPFGDLVLNCPRNAESYLDRTYGAEWRVMGMTHFINHVSKLYAKPVIFDLTEDLLQPAKPFH